MSERPDRRGTSQAGGRLPWVPLVIFLIGALALAFALLVTRRTAPPPAGVALPAQPTPAAVPVAPAGGVGPARAVPTHAATATMPPPVDEPTGVATPLAPVVAATEPPPPATAPPPPAPTPEIVAVFRCSKGAEFNVSPEDAHIAIDGKPIGKADDWDGKGGGETYKFGGEGTHYARISLDGYRTAWVKIVVTDEASEEVADVDTALKETGKDEKDEGEKTGEDRDKDDEGGR